MVMEQGAKGMAQGASSRGQRAEGITHSAWRKEQGAVGRDQTSVVRGLDYRQPTTDNPQPKNNKHLSSVALISVALDLRSLGEGDGRRRWAKEDPHSFALSAT